MKGIEAAKSADVRENELHVVKLQNKTLLLSRVKGELCAVDNKCPHWGLPLAKGKVVDGAVTCPFHGSSFDLCSGANLDWVAALGGKLPLPMWSRKLVSLGQAPAPLPTYPVYEENGAVYVEI